MSTRLPGYFLFYLGIVLIILSTASVYMVFYSFLPSAQPFHLSALTLDSNLLNALGYKNSLVNTSVEVFPASVVNQFVNLFAHLFLMSFIGGVGYKLSMIGVQLLRPINIQVKETIKEVSAY